MKTGKIMVRLGVNTLTVPFNTFNALHILHSDTTDHTRLLFVGASFFFSATCALFWVGDLILLIQSKRFHVEGVPEHTLESRLEAESVHDEEEI